MKNILISNLNEKDVKHCTTNLGLKIRKKANKPFKKLCNIFTNANIIRQTQYDDYSDDDYYNEIDRDYISLESYNLKKGKNNIILERYPKLMENESYIFVCNHTCPEDIETVLNILDRNAYLILGSIESLKYNPEMYLSFLNGMIPFDIMESEQRKLVFEKMKRVVKTNSILIFPEGSHNCNPNKLINNLFDGPVNLALQTNKQIVIVTMLKDNENNVSYIDVGNPIDIRKLENDNKEFKNMDETNEKYYVKKLSSIIRDKMATSVYSIMERHFKPLNRNKFENIEEFLRIKKIEEAFTKLKWNKDVFDAEYLTKNSAEELEYNQVINDISNLIFSLKKENCLVDKEWIKKFLDIQNKDIVLRMRNYLIDNKKSDIKVLKKKK